MFNDNKQTNDSSTQMAQELSQSALMIVKNISDQLASQLVHMAKTMENLATAGQKTSLSGNPNRISFSGGKTQPGQQQDKVENQDDISHNVSSNLSL